MTATLLNDKHDHKSKVMTLSELGVNEEDILIVELPDVKKGFYKFSAVPVPKAIPEIHSDYPRDFIVFQVEDDNEE